MNARALIAAAAQCLAVPALPLLMAACAAPAPFTANWYLVTGDGEREDQKSLAPGVHVALLNRSQQTLKVRTVRINPSANALEDAPGWTIRDDGETLPLPLAPGQMLVGRPRWWPHAQPLSAWPPCTLPVQVEITVQVSQPGSLQRLLQGFRPANRWLLQIDPALPNAMPAGGVDCLQPPSKVAPAAAPRP
jgi:hypothetical protein